MSPGLLAHRRPHPGVHSSALPAWTPASLPGRVARWDFSTLALADGTPITSVPDLAATAGALVPVGIHVGDGAARPTFKTNIQNGLSIGRFDGVFNQIEADPGSDWLTTTTMSVYVVATTAGAALLSSQPNDSSVQDYTDVRCFLMGYSSGTMYRAGGPLSSVTPSAGVMFVQSAIFDGVNERTYLNGVAGSAAAASTGSFAIRRMLLGARYEPGAGQFTHGAVDYGEVYIFNTAHSGGDHTAVVNFLKTKWGIA